MSLGGRSVPLELRKLGYLMAPAGGARATANGNDGGVDVVKEGPCRVAVVALTTARGRPTHEKSIERLRLLGRPQCARYDRAPFDAAPPLRHHGNSRQDVCG